jgi:hypothetical protein
MLILMVKKKKKKIWSFERDRIIGNTYVGRYGLGDWKMHRTKHAKRILMKAAAPQPALRIPKSILP